MNRNFIIGLIVLGVILAGSFFFLIPKVTPLSNNGSVTTDSSDALVSMFMAAYEGNESIKCTFTDDKSEGTAYIKQGKIRFDSMGTDGAQYGNAIVNGKMLYIWQTGSNEGYMIDTSKYQDEDGQMAGQFIDAEKIKDEVAQNKPNCVKEQIDDAMFTPPSTVTFSDFSAMMGDTIQMQNGAMPEGMDSQQYKDLMQQYAQ